MQAMLVSALAGLSAATSWPHAHYDDAVAAPGNARDKSCHTGRGRIYGMHFSGFEIKKVAAKDYGECCAACGVQMVSGAAKKCSWIEWNPNVPQPQCTLKTGQGNVAGQHNGIISGDHGQPPPPPPPPEQKYVCMHKSCVLGSHKSNTTKHYLNATCNHECLGPPGPPPPPAPPPPPKPP
eukprot:SAG22_NODE_2270_length_2767_cov_45.713643_2_plen_179_part_01